MPDDKKTKYDLLQDQIDLIGKRLGEFEMQFNQIKESLSLIDHFKEVLKNVPVSAINERLDMLERNVNDKAIEVSFYEKLDILTREIHGLKKNLKVVSDGISVDEYFKAQDKDVHLIKGDKLVDHQGKEQKKIERPIIEPEIIVYK